MPRIAPISLICPGFLKPHHNRNRDSDDFAAHRPRRRQPRGAREFLCEDKPVPLELRTAQSANLSPRADAPIEWWFVQGSLDDPDGESLHFMTAFFQVRGTDGSSTPGHMLLANVMDSANGNTATISRVTGEIVRTHESIARRFAEAHLDPRISGLALKHHMRHAMAAARRLGVEIAVTPARVSGDPLQIDWHDFTLSQKADEVLLRLPIGRHKEIANLRLSPERSWLCEEGSRLDPAMSPRFFYLSCPRLSVSGDIGGRSVSGRAWMDRQWGTFDGWLVADADGIVRLLGWDWLGLSFDSGHDLLVMRHQLVGFGPCGDGFAVIFDATTVGRARGRFSDQATRHWTSPRTGIVYPLNRRLLIPGISVEIEVAPLAEDQEIPVFGTTAIWEGAVSAEGTIAGRKVRGLGRLELFGYGYTNTVRRYLARLIRRDFGELPGRTSQLS